MTCYSKFDLHERVLWTQEKAINIWVMVLSKGGFKQYILLERTRFIVSAWVSAEYDMGYVVEFFVYTGFSVHNWPQKNVAELLRQYKT